MNARVLLKRSFLTDADVHGAPCPHARRDVDPRPSRTAIPGGQEHPLAIKEAAETEMASVLEEVAAYYAAMVEVLVLAFALAIFEAVTGPGPPPPLVRAPPLKPGPPPPCAATPPPPPPPPPPP